MHIYNPNRKHMRTIIRILHIIYSIQNITLQTTIKLLFNLNAQLQNLEKKYFKNFNFLISILWAMLLL